MLVAEAQAGERLDRLLSLALTDRDPPLTRTRLKQLILDGRVTKGGATIEDPSYRVKPGEVFTLLVPESIAAIPEGQAIPLDVVFEDADLIVVDKPAGMVVHPAPGNPDRTLVNALIAHCGASLSGIGGVRRPGIVHRIDKETSGLVVAAKTDRAHAGLAALFAKHDIERAYLALVWGLPGPAKGTIEASIGRDKLNRKKMAVVTGGGKTALTRYQVEEVFANGAVSLLRCELATGRTHQIRVHLADRGHGLLGDPLYGRSSKARLAALPDAAKIALGNFHRQALHATLLGFKHPVSGRNLSFSTPLPADMASLLAALRLPALP